MVEHLNLLGSQLPSLNKLLMTRKCAICDLKVSVFKMDFSSFYFLWYCQIFLANVDGVSGPFCGFNSTRGRDSLIPTSAIMIIFLNSQNMG